MMNENRTSTITAIFDFDRDELPLIHLMFLFFFLVIAIFQILKPLKNGLFVESFGADIELYAKLLNIVASVAAATAFTFLFNAVKRPVLICVLCLFFIFSFLVLVPLLSHPHPLTIWAFYVLGDLEATLMVAAFWSFLTDISVADQAKRLYGAIGCGGVLGGWAGSAIARTLLHSLGSQGLLLLCSAMMLLVMAVAFQADALGDHSTADPAEDPEPKPSSVLKETVEGARLALSSGYLSAIVGMVGFYEFGSQIIDYQFKVATQGLSGVTETQAFLTNVYFIANGVAVVVQLFLVSLIVKKYGPRPALMVAPIAVMAGSLLFFALPASLLAAGSMVVADNGFNYSIQQTARESLFVVTPREAKYKARAFTNMFVQRLAKGLGTVSLILFGSLRISMRSMSGITIGLMILMVLLGKYAGSIFDQRYRGVRRKERKARLHDGVRAAV